MPKYKRTGVERNLLKRRLREIVRTRLLPALPAGEGVAVDVVIRPNPDAYVAPFDRLSAELARSVERMRRFALAPRLAPAAAPTATPSAPAEGIARTDAAMNGMNAADGGESSDSGGRT